MRPLSRLPPQPFALLLLLLLLLLHDRSFPAAPMRVVLYDCMDRVHDVQRPRDFNLDRVRALLTALGYMTQAHHDLYWFPDGRFGRWAEQRVLIASDDEFARWAVRETAVSGP